MISSLGYAGAQPSKNYATIYAGMVSPLSRGSVTIVSNDTADHPLIDPGWYTNETDIEVAVQAFKRIRSIWNATAMRGVVVGEELTPGPAVETDEEIREYVVKQGTTIYHPSCTCELDPFLLS